MGHIMKKLALATLILTMTASSSMAGNVIRNACLKAGRSSATYQLCGCIQQVADIRLKAKDQRLAASFFKDPHKAQEIRQSDKHAHEVFWTRYKAFGAAAEEACDPANS